ncbi:hypothetical protein BDM02DRAFT_3189694 [Thelephora ganbajun]|uniref:Uncharacterized protein n=1 Tax=Thelephora ganbajun TaxID=370292 RepID=A0ACB6Z8G1_THEGA|nr:hypothetical protein BDM02DRAFT_3189694 [Thelephora ganbajun]
MEGNLLLKATGCLVQPVTVVELTNIFLKVSGKSLSPNVVVSTASGWTSATYMLTRRFVNACLGLLIKNDWSPLLCEGYSHSTGVPLWWAAALTSKISVFPRRYTIPGL